MAWQRWMVTDEVLSDTWTMEINPNAGGEPSTTKPLGTVQTLAPDGDPILYATQPPPKELSWTGTILSLAELAKFHEWVDKQYLLVIEDDLARQYRIWWDKFEPTRQRVTNREYKATYTAHALVVEVL